MPQSKYVQLVLPLATWSFRESSRPKTQQSLRYKRENRDELATFLLHELSDFYKLKENCESRQERKAKECKTIIRCNYLTQLENQSLKQGVAYTVRTGIAVGLKRKEVQRNVPWTEWFCTHATWLVNFCGKAV